jgi:hypothetical protein
VLGQLKTVRHEVDVLEHLVVSLLRDRGASWEEIGDELGITRQAAARRFSHAKPRRNVGH